MVFYLIVFKCFNLSPSYVAAVDRPLPERPSTSATSDRGTSQVWGYPKVAVRPEAFPGPLGAHIFPVAPLALREERRMTLVSAGSNVRRTHPPRLVEGRNNGVGLKKGIINLCYDTYIISSLFHKHQIMTCF